MNIAWAWRHPLQCSRYLLWRQARKTKLQRQRAQDQRQTSFSAKTSTLSPTAIFRLRPNVESRPWTELAAKSHLHEFDLLGSGWTRVAFGVRSSGVEGNFFPPAAAVKPDREGAWLNTRLNSANVSHARSIWRMISADYQPIDWQLDFKSGYRWSEAKWFADLPIVPARGADVKVPWELSRAHHLPQLALAYAVDSSPQHVREFRDQILDFVAQNPPRFGANWLCPMDISIRAVNWIVAFDLFQSAGVAFDREFEQVLARSLYEHGLHIWNQREWHPYIRGNHYLANLCGLIFISARLPADPETDRWLNFAAREFICEVKRQFLPDGGNFEGSTSYHRLSAEMVAYTAGVLLDPKTAGARRTRDLDLNLAQLEKMAEFTTHITKSNGHIVQIGDNDSGRFLKLEPTYYKIQNTWVEDFLDHRGLVSLLNGFARRADLDQFAESKTVGRIWLEAIMPNSKPVASPESISKPQGDAKSWTELVARFSAVPEACGNEMHIAWPKGFKPSSIAAHVHSDFGVYIFKATNFTLAVRCGSRCYDGTGGHAHNDQLSLELEIAGKDLVVDPGTYLYTPSPESRNRYRSVRAHFAPALENEEPGAIDRGLFQLVTHAQSEVLHFSEGKFAGWHRGFSQPVYRLVEINETGVWIRDFTLGESPLAKPTPPLPFSDGYGRLKQAVS